jgi:hypothetical protein
MNLCSPDTDHIVLTVYIIYLKNVSAGEGSAVHFRPYVSMYDILVRRTANGGE